MTAEGEAGLTWCTQASLAQVEEVVRAAAARVGLSSDLGPDRSDPASGGPGGALCGWAYVGTSFGTPTGRMDVAELRLTWDSRGGTVLRVLPVEVQLPNRFAKPWIYHEIRVRKPLLWNAFVSALRRELGGQDSPAILARP